jgi:23S rRNA (cytosine1962-C5)-methyltransferase
LEGRAAGDVVRLVTPEGSPLGAGIADPGSPIAIRVWVTGGEALDDALLDRRIASALAVRARLFGNSDSSRGKETTAYRILHGEGDRMPGFVVDRYETVAVLRLDGPAAEAYARAVVPRLWPALQAFGITTLVRRDSGTREGPKRLGGGKGGSGEGLVLEGPPPPATIHVREHGMPFVVDLLRGQKTGAFLDQRENRRRVRGIVASLPPGNTRVLNLFSYAGGFSLAAALGGAGRVTSVDVAAGAHATAETSFKLAGVDPRTHEFVTADAFAFLDSAKKSGRTWDLVVSDPPSFAPNEKSLGRALQAYRALHRACADVLAPGGVLCAASCSSHVDASAFAGTLDDGSLARTDLRLLTLDGPGADHPTLPAWPEGRYLKFAVLA